jgi:uncharacterized protein YjbI with pentapeptide repeats
VINGSDLLYRSVATECDPVFNDAFNNIMRIATMPKHFKKNPTAHLYLERRIALDRSVPVTAETLKAGLVEITELDRIDMEGADLFGTEAICKSLRRANFERADLRNAVFNGSVLRRATFADADLAGASFRECDLRGVNFAGANLFGVVFHKARLEGAKFAGAAIQMCDLRASFNEKTTWPDGFDPARHGAVEV